MGSARLVDGDLQHLRLLCKLGVVFPDLRGVPQSQEHWPAVNESFWLCKNGARRTFSTSALASGSEKKKRPSCFASLSPWQAA